MANISLDPRAMRNVSKAIAKRMENVGDELAENVASLAKSEAEIMYASDELEYDGDPTQIKVEVRKSERGTYNLAAKGPGVRAIEYGTLGIGPKVLVDKEGNAFWFFKADEDVHFGTEFGWYKQVPMKVIKEYEGRYEKGKWTERLVGHYGADWDSMKEKYGDDDDMEGFLEFRKEELAKHSAFLKKNWKKSETIEGRYTKNRKEAMTEDDDRFGYTRGNEPQEVLKKAVAKAVEEAMKYV